MTTRAEILWRQGATLDVTLATDADLTGRSLRGHVRTRKSSSLVMIDLADPGTLSVVDGGIRVQLGAQAGEAVQTGGRDAPWVFDIEAVSDTDPEDVIRTHEGAWIVSADVTRSGTQTPAMPDGDLRYLRAAQIVEGTGVTITQSGTGADLTLTFESSGGGGGGAPSGTASGDLGGTYPAPTVTQARGLRETSGPATLAVGAVSDGQMLRRVGAAVVGDDRVARRVSAATAALEGDESNYLIIGSDEGFQAYRSGSILFYCGSAGFGLALDQELWWSDSKLGRVAENTVAQHNGVNPQTFWLYNNDGGANFERVSIGWESNVCTIQPQAGGTGSLRPLLVKHPPVTLATLPTAAAAGAGARSFISDSTHPMLGHAGEAATGGGSNSVPVYSDGTNWRIG